MCYALYIASDVPLATSDTDDERPEFYVCEAREAPEGVTKHFSKAHIYYVGAHTNCSCGFFFCPEWTYDESRKGELQEEKASAQRLVSYLSSALEQTHELELFVSWEGDQHEISVRTKHMSPQDLLGEEFALDEGDFVIISKKP